MLVDPRARRRRRGRTSAPSSAPAPVAVIAALAIEVSALVDLAGWEPCGSLLEEIPAAARGDGALTRAQVARLRMWAANWRALARDVRAFYATHHDEPAVQSGLWYVLGTGSRPQGAALGRLRRAYCDAYGHPPGIDLTPRPATREDPP